MDGSTTKFRSVGDVNFFEYGILIRRDPVCDTAYSIIRCIPVPEYENTFRYGELYVDIADDWIDKASVTAFCGLNKDSSSEDFAIACSDFYAWENFGVEIDATREEVQKILSNYLDAGAFPDEPWVKRLFEKD